jgi:phosphatidylserine/phosphatidylglycerophosphate/cardiolipin synthase-like enzyme
MNLLNKAFRFFAALMLLFIFSCGEEVTSQPVAKTPVPQASRAADNQYDESYSQDTTDNTQDNADQAETPDDGPTPLPEVSEPPKKYRYQEVAAQYAAAQKKASLSPLSPLAQKVYDQVTNDSLSKAENSPLSKADFLTANNKFIKTLVDGEQIFGGFKEIIAKAENEVDILCFGWDTNSDAERLIGEGIKLAQLNVRDGKKLLVRIIVDDIQLDFAAEINDLNSARKNWQLDQNKVNLQLAVYPHLGFASLHSKYLVVDGKYTIVTGANVENVYDFNENAWHDTGYMFEGPLAKTVLKDFDEAWEKHARHMECKDRKFAKDCQEVNYSERPNRDYQKNYNYSSGFPVIALAKTGKDLFSNEINNPQDQAWLAVMENAASHINIESPNINDDAFLKAVVETVKRGINVNILTGNGNNDTAENVPGQGGTNIEAVKKLQSAVIKEIPAQKDKLQIRWYSRDGVNPVLGREARASHTKFMSADAKVAIVGSGNLDTQSWNQSREFNVLIDDASVTQNIENAFFNKDWEKAVKIPFENLK